MTYRTGHTVEISPDILSEGIRRAHVERSRVFYKLIDKLTARSASRRSMSEG